jgi:hypothetical protein
VSEPVTITYVPEWRASYGDESTPSREAWLVTCAEHGWIGKNNTEPWGYTESDAKRAATRHRNACHREAR